MSYGKLLEGFVILDFTQYVASAFGTKILADMGAELLKVERYPLGDLMRVGGVQDLIPGVQSSQYFLNCCEGKKSICVDFRNPEGVKLIKELVPHVDAVMEGYTPGQMKKYGLDYETLSEIKPDIVYASLTGFGQYGPYRDWVSFAPQAEAISGLYHMIGYPDGPPLICGTGVADPNAASHACLSVLGALLCRERTGTGQHVDTAMMDSMVFMDVVAVPRAAITEGEDNPWRSGQHHGMLVPWGNYHCKGEYVQLQVIGYGEESMWGRFCKAVGRPDMITDPRFDTPEHRVENGDETIRIIQEWFDQQPSAFEAAAYLNRQHRVCAVPVQTSRQVALGPQVKERELMAKVYHPWIDREATVPVTPYKYSKTPIKVESGAPLLGQHNEYILEKYLGYSEQQVKELYDKTIIYRDPRVVELRAKGKI